MDRLRALQAYVRIVELGSFTAASKDLRIRQATVSRWIAELEDELNVQLLLRTTRAVSETDAGREFYQRAKLVLASWDEAVGSVRDVVVTGRVRVSVPVVFGEKFITPLVPTFMTQNPGAQLELAFSDTYVDLANSGFDIAIRVGRPVDSDYRQITLGNSPRRLVASPNFVADHDIQTPADLSNVPCLVHSGVNNRAVWSFSRDEKQERVDVSGRLVANHSSTLVHAAVNGLGVALAAGWLVDEFIDRGELVHLLRNYDAPPAPIQAIYATTRHVPIAVRTFLEFLSERLGDDERIRWSLE